MTVNEAICIVLATHLDRMTADPDDPPFMAEALQLVTRMAEAGRDSFNVEQKGRYIGLAMAGRNSVKGSVDVERIRNEAKAEAFREAADWCDRIGNMVASLAASGIQQSNELVAYDCIAKDLRKKAACLGLDGPRESQ